MAGLEAVFSKLKKVLRKALTGRAGRCITHFRRCGTECPAEPEAEAEGGAKKFFEKTVKVVDSERKSG